MKRCHGPGLGIFLLSMMMLIGGFMLVIFIVLGILPSTFLWNGLAFFLSSVGLWIGISAGARFSAGDHQNKDV